MCDYYKIKPNRPNLTYIQMEKHPKGVKFILHKERRIMNLHLLAAVTALGGVATALQAHFMGLMDKRLGTLESVFITYFSGGVLIGLIMLIQRGGNLSTGAAAPWYAYSSGALGLVIVGTLSYSAPRLGWLPRLRFSSPPSLRWRPGRSFWMDGLHRTPDDRLTSIRDGSGVGGIWLIIRE